MNIVLFANNDSSGSKDALQNIILESVPTANLEVIQAVQLLKHRTKKLPKDIEAAVILAKDETQLTELSQMADMLEGIQIILILPDDSKQTASKGYLLRPRFTDYAGSDFSNIGPVLHKMIKRNEINNNFNKKGDLASMTESTEIINQVIGVVDREGKYLTFSLAKEEYGIGILKVREIIGMMPVTTVPQTPDFVKGVINLRGKVIPVIDLRLKFGMESIEYTERTCIIVVEITGIAGELSIGIVVDAVSEVINIPGTDIEDTPTFGAKLNTEYILGMAKMDQGVKILLDISRILGVEELAIIENAA